ncbi:MAG: hypothetical protein Q9208_007491 [Pyrenodesmia sp. 3 TL-2023]
MRLSGAEEALCSAIRAMLQRVANDGSSSLVKKVLQLEGLAVCMQRGAEEEPDIIDGLFFTVKEALTKGKKIQREQLERKRLLDRERHQEDRERAKRLKSTHTPTDNVPATTTTMAQGAQHTVTTNVSTQPVDRRSPSRSNHESETSDPALEPEVSRQTSEREEVVEDRSRQGSHTSSRSSSEEPLRARWFNGRMTTSAPQRPICHPSPSRSSSDDEKEVTTANTNTAVPASRAAPPSTRVDCVGTGPGGGAGATNSDDLPSTQTTQVATLTAANLASLSAPRATASEIIDEREVALVSGNEAQKETLKGHLLQHVWPRFKDRSNLKHHEQDVEEIVTMTERLNFWQIKDGILMFGKKRMQSPGAIARISELAGNPDPVAVFHAIEASSSTEDEVRLHKVYAQVRLVRCINTKVDNGYKPTETKLLPRTTRKHYAKYFLSDMADSMCKDEPKEMRDKKWRKLCSEYDAGRKWLETMETFNGEGIAFIVVFAGK